VRVRVVVSVTAGREGLSRSNDNDIELAGQRQERRLCLAPRPKPGRMPRPLLRQRCAV